MIAKTSIDHELCFSLLDWYVREKRDLPWRNTRDPWLILLSESSSNRHRCLVVSVLGADFRKISDREVLGEIRRR